MEIRVRATGAAMQEQEFRAYQQANGGPTWDRTTDEVLEALGADVVFEGPQATTTPPYEFSYRNGVEQIDGKWYTKYSVGPVFTDRPAEVFVRGDGAWLWDEHGRRYLDWLQGWAVNALGHCPAVLTEALQTQAGLLLTPSPALSNRPSMALAERLCALSGMHQIGRAHV